MQVGHDDIVACAECEKDATAMAFEKVKCERPQVSLFIFIVTESLKHKMVVEWQNTPS